MLREFRTLLRDKMALLRLDDSMAGRYVNEGFSGGEKKRLEMLQMAVLEPKLAILDETDSGLDIDALRIVAEGVNAMLNRTSGSCSSPTTSACSTTSSPTSSTSSPGADRGDRRQRLALRLEEGGYGPDPPRPARWTSTTTPLRVPMSRRPARTWTRRELAH
jgi:hypothetical protein